MGVVSPEAIVCLVESDNLNGQWGLIANYVEAILLFIALVYKNCPILRHTRTRSIHYSTPHIHTIPHLIYTLFHTSYTLFHTPYTLFHTPYTLFHTSYTLFHTSYTLFHTSYRQERVYYWSAQL